MTNAELIEKLKKLPLDLDVVASHGDDGDTREIYTPRIELVGGADVIVL